MTVFEAYITNLGKYAEGQLVGETLKFPATTEEVQSLLKNIGVDGVLYEEFFITAFDGDVMGLYDYLTEYENLDELNHRAAFHPLPFGMRTILPGAASAFPRKRNVSGSWGCRKAGQSTARTARKFYPPTVTGHWETPSRCPVLSTSWRGLRRR